MRRVVALALCGSCTSPDATRPDRLIDDATLDVTAPEASFEAASPDRARPEDAGVDVAHDEGTDATIDATPVVSDAVSDIFFNDMGSCGLDASRLPPREGFNGYIRFIHVARGLGSVRFRARNQPMYRAAYMEAVVPEGASSPHIELLAVNYTVEVELAGDAGASFTVTPDDGGFPDVPLRGCSDDAGAGELARPHCTTVYFGGGCTVVLSGSRMGDVARQTDVRLRSLVDLPTRTGDCAVSSARLVNVYAEGPAIDVDTADGAALARAMEYYAPTGTRRLSPGALRLLVRGLGDGGAPRALAATLNPGHGHTLFLWGDARSMTNPDIDALLVDDVPMSRW